MPSDNEIPLEAYERIFGEHGLNSTPQPTQPTQPAPAPNDNELHVIPPTIGGLCSREGACLPCASEWTRSDIEQGWLRPEFRFRTSCPCINCLRYRQDRQEYSSAPLAPTQPAPPIISSPQPENIMPLPRCTSCGTAVRSTSNNQAMRRSTMRRSIGASRSMQYMCRECMEAYSFTCTNCSIVCHTEQQVNARMAGTTDTVRICAACASNHFTACADCHFYVPRSTVQRDESDMQYRCADCYGASIRSYNFRLNLAPVGTSKHNIFFGGELEVEVWSDGTEQSRRNKVKEVREALGNFVEVKADGSLTPNRGFEIVTRPASITEHKKNWPKFFDSGVVKDLKSFQTKTCGIHFHVSRKPLSELAIAKIVCFVNARHNRRFVEMVAGRSSEQWSKFIAKRLHDKENWAEALYPIYDTVNGIKQITSWKKSKQWKNNERKYEAVNLRHKETIEFRIFRGTLKKESFFKNLEFVDAVVRFCYPDNRSVRECMARSKFLDYVEKHKDLYPHLAAFISARWFGKETEDSVKFGFKTKADAPGTEDEL
jgi:hypothetical protein